MSDDGIPATGSEPFTFPDQLTVARRLLARPDLPYCTFAHFRSGLASAFGGRKDLTWDDIRTAFQSVARQLRMEQGPLFPRLDVPDDLDVRGIVACALGEPSSPGTGLHRVNGPVAFIPHTHPVTRLRPSPGSVRLN